MTLFRNPALVFVLALSAWAGPGRDAFDKHCRRCHGPDGSGMYSIAAELEATFRHLGSAEVQKVGDGELRNWILKGNKKMNPVRDITPTELRDVVGFFRGIKMTPPDVSAGKIAFEKYCAACHGSDGKASGQQKKMRALASTEVQRIKDADLKHYILDGKGTMEPIRRLTKDELLSLTLYFRSLRQ